MTKDILGYKFQKGAVNFEKLYEKLSLKFKLLLFPVNFCWEKLLVHICISRCNLTQANDENHTYFLLIIWDNIRYMPYIMQSASKISQNTHFMHISALQGGSRVFLILQEFFKKSPKKVAETQNFSKSHWDFKSPLFSLIFKYFL